ncbi:hypothetical protein tb265_32480 [Gemmatimonadetes bacterium T265]|nr:hypothetical protein tb265_32480 [Gemmatimonadetes bacterium T265]
MLTPAHRRYLRAESALSAAINGAISVGFVLAVFHGQPRVGADALVRDALPQSFMVALMGSAVPTLVTRRRLRAGAVAPLPVAGAAMPANVAVRAVLIAVPVAVVAVAAHWLLLPRLLSAAVPFGRVLAGKALYGALLGAGVTWFAVRAALADGERVGADRPPRELA